MPRSCPENGATAVSMIAVSSTLLVLLGREVTAMLSLQTKLLAVSLAWAGLFQLQRVLVGKRRCSRHWLVQYGAMAAYYLPAPLAFYAAKAVSYSTSNIDKSTPFLVTSVLTMLGNTIFVSTQMGVLVTNMRAYSLRERSRDRYNFVLWLVFLGCVDWEWARISIVNLRRQMEDLCYSVALMFLHFVPASVILFANTSESTLDCQTKAVADYMKRESSKSSGSPFFGDDDANSNSSLHLDCCRYPFVQGKDGEWVTVKDLVQRDDLPNEDQDIWLSYSLCRLLARHYYGFHCAEEGDDMVRHFALADLGTTDRYKRAFTIVEVQLAFLHDYFFTALLPIIQSGLLYTSVTQFSIFALPFTLLDSPVTILIRPDGLGTNSLQIMVMAVMILLLSWSLLFGLPMLPVKDLLAFYWRPIHTVFHKLNCLPDPDRHRLPAGLVRLFRSSRNTNAHDVFDPFQTQTTGVYWRNKIGQYSILQDYDRRSRKKELVAWFQRIMLSQPSYKFIKHLPIQDEEVDMLELDNMRELIADTLRAIDGPPTNGTRSLKINIDEINRGSVGYDWLLTCKQETHTDTIPIWHIATSYCDMTTISDDPLVKWHYEAARALSRYCAYLVAFLPEFLPEHSLTSKQVFQRVLQEARHELGEKPMEEEEKRTKIRGLELPDQHEQRTTFHKGVELGRQLEMLNDDKVRWRVIAEFWAEMILYVAPSDNAEAHIEHLAKGGEFITHLWAMLCNAGILKRATGEWHPSTSTTKKAPPKKTETTKARTQECPF